MLIEWRQPIMFTSCVREKENCYRMRASSMNSFVVVVLAPHRPLVFFLVFTYVQGRQVCHMTPLYTVEILGHWWLARKTWLGHACWSQDREATKLEISSCLIYCGYSHTVKRCAIFWKHQLYGMYLRKFTSIFSMTKVMCYFLYFLAKKVHSEI